MSWPTVTFLDSAKVNSVEVNRPAWGYVTEIHMPIVITQAHDGSYPDNGFFDTPDETEPPVYGTYDYRVMSASLWRLTDAQKTLFNAFMRDASMGRAQDVYMRLSAVSIYTGFYPFGVDMCDNGDYRVRFIDRSQAGKQMRPFRWHEEDISMVVISKTASSYYAPARNEGKLFIGDISTGFAYPQNGIKPKSSYCHMTQILSGGAPSSISGPQAGDSWETEFELLCNTGNAAQLINQLVNISRTSDIQIVVPDHFDMFGADQSANGAGGTYNAKFLGSERTDKEIVLRIIHEGFDKFRIPMSFWMESKS